MFLWYNVTCKKEKNKGVKIMKNWKMLPLTLLPGVERLVNSNKELRDKMTKLMFTQKGDFNNIDWSKTKIFVPGDATTAVWLKKAIMLKAPSETDPRGMHRTSVYPPCIRKSTSVRISPLRRICLSDVSR